MLLAGKNEGLKSRKKQNKIMRKYKIELTQSEKFVVDVLAENETEAEKIAKDYFEIIERDGRKHYYSQTGEAETEVGEIYDVSETDDPFNAEN